MRTDDKIQSCNFRDVLTGDESLKIFLRAMAKFERRFCDSMASGEDFTIKMEVHGNKGEMIHCRIVNDEFERPCGVERRVETKKRIN